jgi:hypothetical protein
MQHTVRMLFPRIGTNVVDDLFLNATNVPFIVRCWFHLKAQVRKRVSESATFACEPRHRVIWKILSSLFLNAVYAARSPFDAVVVMSTILSLLEASTLRVYPEMIIDGATCKHAVDFDVDPRHLEPLCWGRNDVHGEILEKVKDCKTSTDYLSLVSLFRMYVRRDENSDQWLLVFDFSESQKLNVELKLKHTEKVTQAEAEDDHKLAVVTYPFPVDVPVFAGIPLGDEVEVANPCYHVDYAQYLHNYVYKYWCLWVEVCSNIR